MLAIADKVSELKREIGEILGRATTEDKFDAIGTCVSRHEQR